MKVYLVMSDWASEYDGSECAVEVFGTYEKAKEKFDKTVAEEKENDHLFCTDEPAFEERKDYFSVWEDGYYLSDHFTIQIVEKEVII